MSYRQDPVAQPATVKGRLHHQRRGRRATLPPLPDLLPAEDLHRFVGSVSFFPWLESSSSVGDVY